MPTYEYECPKCGHTFEHVQSMRDERLTKCPVCKKAGLKRLVGGGAGLIFKGSGFYITDYKNKRGTAHKDTGSETSKPADSKPASTTSDHKPAPSAAATPAKK